MQVRVETQAGALEGVPCDAGLRFDGIPFASARRFAAPEAPSSWDGVRTANAPGPAAPQGRFMLPLPGMEVGPTGEDCLSLNVVTPSTEGRRPVLVWFHGGAYVLGAGSQPIYDARRLMERGDVVVVTPNYRLGVLGYLDFTRVVPDLAEATPNAGLLDQVAALAWVREHIDRFGGDPHNVTIFGESAGGMSVGTLLGTPAARGSFHRAIPQSGAAHNVHTPDSNDDVALRFLSALGVAPEQAAAALRSLPPEKLVEAQQTLAFGGGRTTGHLPFQPVVDGSVLPEAPLDAIRGGIAADVPVLVGTTRDEWKLFGFIDPQLREATDETLPATVRERFGAIDAEAALAVARAQLGGDPSAPDVLAALETDRVFRIPAIRLAEAQREHAPVYMYRFDWESPLLGGQIGAGHGIDVAFVFGALGSPGADQFVGSGPEAEALSERTMDAWLAFARTGDPGHGALPNWPPYDLERRATLCFNANDALIDAPDDALRAHWDGLL